jgi:ribosomal protein S18 acetylase RimI-like enzyme
VRLRDAALADLPTLIALEAATPQTSWSAKQIEEELGHADATARIAVEADDESSLLGWAAWRSFTSELWLLEVCVAAGARRRGVGRALVDDGLALARGLGRDSLWLEVRASNAPARALYEVCGFEAAGTRPRYYPPLEAGGEREDAIILRRGVG